MLAFAAFLTALPAYRLTAQCPDGTPPPCRGARVATGPTTNSVAVLYFDNASRDTADAYLADGITEEIISRLGQVGGRVQVKSRYAVRRYRGAQDENPQTIGRQLAVASIVTGSVRRAGNRLRVTAEMVRTANGDVIWSERYDRAETDVLSLQSDLAGAVATAITGRLLPAERRAIAAQPTRNREAWDHFVRGNYYLATRLGSGYRRALAEYETAARLDPGFTRPLARAAYVYGVAAWRSQQFAGLQPDSSWRLGRLAADRAVRADSALSDAWMALGLAQIQRPESLAVGRVSLERALALDSSNAEAMHVYAWLLYYQGRRAEWMAAFQKVLSIEPGRPITLAMLGYVAATEGRRADARRWYDSTIVADRSFFQGYQLRALLRYADGDTAGYRADMAVTRALTNDPSIDTVVAAYVALRAGDSTQLRAWAAAAGASLAQPGAWDDARVLMIAVTSVWLGENETAIDWLERTRFRNVNFYINCLLPPLDRLRGNPRYERLLDEWRVPAGVR